MVPKNSTPSSGMVKMAAYLKKLLYLLLWNWTSGSTRTIERFSCYDWQFSIIEETV